MSDRAPRFTPAESEQGRYRLSKVARGVLAGLGLTAGFLAACSGAGPFSELLRPQTPWESYRSSLEASELADTTAGRAWMAAAARALAEASTIALPHREVLHFDPLEPTAEAWRMRLERGQELRVALNRPPADEQRLFVDVLRLDRQEWVPIAALEEGRQLQRRIDESGVYALRLQPELLAGGRWTVTIAAGASLAFPVEGQTSRAIGGRFGDPRDDGRRRHHGVDIFASRGTGAIAADDGVATRVGDNRLGGKVVWLRTDGGLSLYYAHLDRQLVRSGRRVAAGDLIGRVGTTGNAAGTPPHLHFGVYDDGPVDPAPYIHEPRERPDDVTADLSRLGSWTRVSRPRVNLRGAPGTGAAVVGGATRHQALWIEGASAHWYRVTSPAGAAYVHSDLIESLDSPIGRLRIERATPLLHRPTPSAAIVGEAIAGVTLELLAEQGEYWLVRQESDGRARWMARSATQSG